VSKEPCLICGKPVEYEPEYCCPGIDCTCYGQPVNPCICSEECEGAVFDYIGLDFEDRLIKAGIEKYSEPGDEFEQRMKAAEDFMDSLR